jgi:hypothetical protein
VCVYRSQSVCANIWPEHNTGISLCARARARVCAYTSEVKVDKVDR